MPKRSSDSCLHNPRQCKYRIEDTEILPTVYDRTVKRLFEASKTIKPPQQAEIKQDSTEQVSVPSCNQCFDIDPKQTKMKCEFCEKSNCLKCLDTCYKCRFSFCSNCITVSYTITNDDEAVCYSCVNKRVSI